MYFEAHVVAPKFRRKMLATAAPHFSDVFFFTSAHKKIPRNSDQGELDKMKSLIGTRDYLVAATCAESATRRREGKAKT
jgi:hypothetical protein